MLKLLLIRDGDSLHSSHADRLPVDHHAGIKAIGSEQLSVPKAGKSCNRVDGKIQQHLVPKHRRCILVHRRCKSRPIKGGENHLQFFRGRPEGGASELGCPSPSPDHRVFSPHVSTVGGGCRNNPVGAEGPAQGFEVTQAVGQRKSHPLGFEKRGCDVQQGGNLKRFCRENYEIRPLVKRLRTFKFFTGEDEPFSWHVFRSRSHDTKPLEHCMSPSFSTHVEVNFVVGLREACSEHATQRTKTKNGNPHG